jgi:hypothetical protein
VEDLRASGIGGGPIRLRPDEDDDVLGLMVLEDVTADELAVDLEARDRLLRARHAVARGEHDVGREQRARADLVRRGVGGIEDHQAHDGVLRIIRWRAVDDRRRGSAELLVIARGAGARRRERADQRRERSQRSQRDERTVEGATQA